MEQEWKRDISNKPKLKNISHLKKILLYRIMFPLYYLNIIEVFFLNTKADYINNIMHNNADFINLNLEQKLLF